MKIKDILQYRVWYKPDGKTKDGFLSFSLQEEGGVIFIVMDKDKECRYPVDCIFTDDDWIIDRPTGLKDKNGTLIYTEDWLGTTGSKSRVRYNEKMGAWYLGYERLTAKKALNLEIVCNTYQKNPELLTK